MNPGARPNESKLRVGIVTGLASEAGIIRRYLKSETTATEDVWNKGLGCAGADPARARALGIDFVESGATGLVSFGVAGGLDPDHRAGDLVLADEVVPPKGAAYPTDRDWREALMREARAAGLDATSGRLLGSDVAVVSRPDKAELFRRHGATVVDMESHGVATVAAAAGIPFLVVRAVADPAARALPRAVLGAVGSDGRARAGRVAAKLCLSPWELPAVLALGRDMRRALNSLTRLLDSGGRTLFGGG